MDRSDLALLGEYNEWANRRVLSACQGLTAEQMHAPARASFGSLMGTLAHILGAEMVWRMRMQEGISPGRIVTGEDFADLPALTAVWDREMVLLREFLAGLDEQTARQEMHYTTMAGKPQHNPLWLALAQVYFHGTQFRGEAGLVLAGLDRSPGDLDFILFLREKSQR